MQRALVGDRVDDLGAEVCGGMLERGSGSGIGLGELGDVTDVGAVPVEQVVGDRLVPAESLDHRGKFVLRGQEPVGTL